ncbi:MAG: hypothetical protein DLM70_18425 [Chloroflexi bacterium]|nr:MAG: hypothetical protein DLM70_18425 [Chloroflexota bacterium]
MGRDKALLRLGDTTILQHAVETLLLLTDDVIVVGRTSPTPGARSCVDEIPEAGPLGGIYSALRCVRHDLTLVVACDMPLLNAELLGSLVELASGYDAVVPRIDGRAHPTHAVYARACLPAIDLLIHRGTYSLQRLVEHIRTRWVETPEIDRFDPRHLSVVNANTPEEWVALLETCRTHSPGSSGERETS